jgi:hypothetical protein
MAEGCTNIGIARRLWHNECTVETHIGQHHGEARPAHQRRGTPPRPGLTYLGQRSADG